MFDFASPIAHLVTMLGTLGGMQHVYTGVPESLDRRVSAYVTLGSVPMPDQRTQTLRAEINYFVGFAYRVAEAEATAETTLAALLAAFSVALYADRTLGGTVNSARIDTALANDPRYQVRAGSEFRVYPVLVVCTQEQTFPLPQP